MKELLIIAAVLLFIVSLGCASINEFDNFITLWCTSLILAALAYIISLIEK